MKKVIILLMMVFQFFCVDVNAQTNKPRKSFERMFYSLPYKSLEMGVLRTAKKHKIYSGIIANLSTPYYDVVGALPAEDRRELLSIIPNTDGNIDRRVIAEYVLSKFAQNSKQYTAMITIWSGKKSSLNRIVTLGK